MEDVKQFEKYIKVRLSMFENLVLLINEYMNKVEKLESFNDSGFNQKLNFKERVIKNVKNKKILNEKLLNEVKDNCQIILGNVMFDNTECLENCIYNFNFINTYNDFKGLFVNTKNYIDTFIKDNKTNYKTLVLGNYSVIKGLKKCAQCYINALSMALDYANENNKKIDKQAEN